MNSSPSTSFDYARFVEPIMKFYATTWNNVPEIESQRKEQATQ